PYYLSVFPPASLPSLADATASTRSGALQDGENILRKWSRYLMSAALEMFFHTPILYHNTPHVANKKSRPLA
ncbi:MAG: hypothetical protein IKQ97_03285, partial [Eubacterium sp.]|nr:hypothetical protein [Eubacterium sp.]